MTTCTNTAGSRTCGACPGGYSGTGATGCVDINECLTNNGGCDVLTTCTNTIGSRACGACPSGYSGTGATGCTDVNECLTNNGGCDVLTTCTNTVGSRTCGGCPAGYTGTGATGCSDVNECLSNNGGCDELTTCTNSPGSFSCSACPSGYSGTGLTGCTDINECLTNNGGCDVLTTCTNTPGSRTCGACPSGYTGSGATVCTDINECLTNNGGCSSSATCANTAGSFTCTCNAGFSGNGVTCTAPGCSDGTREGFLSPVTYPNIAGCSGGWSVPGVLSTSVSTCSRIAGDSSSNPTGSGCSSADLCAVGWHVCTTNAQVAAKSSTGDCSGVTTGVGSSVFFATLQSGSGNALCEATGANDLFGCGNIGTTPNSGCNPLTRSSGNLCGGLGAPWVCTSLNGGYDETQRVVKTASAGGGVLCCTD